MVGAGMALDAAGGRPSCRRAAPDRAGGWILPGRAAGRHPVIVRAKTLKFPVFQQADGTCVLRTTSVVGTATLIASASFPESSQATLQMRSTGQGTGRATAHEGEVTGSFQIHKSLPWGRAGELTQAGVRSRLSERTRLPPERAGARGPLLSRVRGRVLRPPPRPAPTPAGGSGSFARQSSSPSGQGGGASSGEPPGHAWDAGAAATPGRQ